jgi:hypothetical protein
MQAVELLFLEFERARSEGDLIRKVSASDKEYHFQNWVEERLKASALQFDEVGRNTYPDFRLVQSPLGFEVKGLAYPGRTANYDSNSQMPSGSHNGRDIYYVFGRYPKDIATESSYPVLDLVLCHGSFLNADSDYVHENKSVREFGSYGDILIRDRKMYVVPTPFALVEGTAGLGTLIVPEQMEVGAQELVRVGDLTRREVTDLVRSYEFDLETNEMITHTTPNPNAGREHKFAAYRVRGHGEGKPIRLTKPKYITSLVSE